MTILGHTLTEDGLTEDEIFALRISTNQITVMNSGHLSL